MDRAGNRQLSEWPSFWTALFSGFALLASVVIAPRFLARQTRLERMADSREIIRQRELSSDEWKAGDPVAIDLITMAEYESDGHRVQLITLRAILAAIFFGAAFRVRSRLQSTARQESVDSDATAARMA